jgi:hypothetical protein
MNYKRIYDNLMESRLLLKEDRIKLKKHGEYFEAHHIIPVSMGGTGSICGWSSIRHPNIIVLTAREHYIAHALLWLIHRTRETASAFRTMCTIKTSKRNYVTSIILYEALKEDMSRFGVSEETRMKMRKKRSEEARMRMRVKKSSVPLKTPEHKEKIRQALLGRKLTPELKEKIRQGCIKRHKSPEHKEKLRQAQLGKKHSPERTAKRVETLKRNRLLGITKPMVRTPEWNKKIGQAQLGKKHSPERIAKRVETFKRNRLLGITNKQVRSPEHKEKLRQAHLGKKHSPERIAKRVETRKRNKLLKLAQMEGSGGQGE